MSSKEDAIRKAAAALKKAIDDAREDGLLVTWPNTPAGLDTIAVSQGKAPTPQPLPADAGQVEPAAAAKKAGKD